MKERLGKLQGGPQMPLTVHLRQEIDCLNIVINLTRTMLSNLRLAIAGKLLPVAPHTSRAHGCLYQCPTPKRPCVDILDNLALDQLLWVLNTIAVFRNRFQIRNKPVCPFCH